MYIYLYPNWEKDDDASSNTHTNYIFTEVFSRVLCLQWKLSSMYISNKFATCRNLLQYPRFYLYCKQNPKNWTCFFNPKHVNDITTFFKSLIALITLILKEKFYISFFSRHVRGEKSHFFASIAQFRDAVFFSRRNFKKRNVQVVH